MKPFKHTSFCQYTTTMKPKQCQEKVLTKNANLQKLQKELKPRFLGFFFFNWNYTKQHAVALFL